MLNTERAFIPKTNFSSFAYILPHEICNAVQCWLDILKAFVLARLALETIKRDNEQLKEELRIENKLSVAPTTEQGNILLAQLQDESDILTRKV